MCERKKKCTKPNSGKGGEENLLKVLIKCHILIWTEFRSSLINCKQYLDK